MINGDDGGARAGAGCRDGHGLRYVGTPGDSPLLQLRIHCSSPVIRMKYFDHVQLFMFLLLLLLLLRLLVLLVLLSSLLLHQSSLIHHTVPLLFVLFICFLLLFVCCLMCSGQAKPTCDYGVPWFRASSMPLESFSRSPRKCTSLYPTPRVRQERNKQ